MNYLQRRSETKLETAAFVYPRLVKLVCGSRDMEDSEDAAAATAIIGAIGIVGVPLTLICSPPALAIRSGRNIKNKLKRWGSSSKDS